MPPQKDGNVPSSLEIACANCGTLYRVGARHPDISVLFHCLVCHEHCLYYLGRVVQLNTQVMTNGDYAARRAHVQQRFEDCALDALAEARDRLGDVININVDVDFATRIDPPSLDHFDPDEAVPDQADGPLFETPYTPQFEEAQDSVPISDAEVDAFRRSLDDPDFWRQFDDA